MAGRTARGAFSPRWVDERLKSLLPAFPDVSLCVALSGGVDSTALLAALATQRGQYTRLRAINIDHGLHANSPKWSAHCRAFAASVGVPVEVLKINVGAGRGDSLEAAARDARYAVLAAALEAGEVLLTGHHEDDQMETVLLQLFRGSGLAGLAAMPALTRFGAGWLCRPLLTMTRDALQSWLSARQVGWVEDDSNADETFDRNYLRQRILPLVRNRWPSVGATVARSARHAAEGQQLLEWIGSQDTMRAADGDSLRAAVLRALPLDRRRNALRFWIAHRGAPLPDTRRLEEICSVMLDARDDAQPRVAWGGVCIQRESGRLTIRPVYDSVVGVGADAVSGCAVEEAVAGAGGSVARVGEESVASDAGVPVRGESPEALVGAAGPSLMGADSEIAWPWRSTRQCELPEGRGKLELRDDPRGPLDLDALPDSLWVRGRRGGERLRPRRGGRSRALKSLLQESQVPVAERGRLPMLYCGERLIAVADLWLDESVHARAGALHRGRIRWLR